MKTYGIGLLAIAYAASASAAPFSGGWLEARGGWDSPQLSIEVDNLNASGSKSGFLYGAAGGYDFAVSPSVVLGLHVGIYGSTAKECSEFYGNDQLCINAGRDFELLGRAGVRAGKATLIYALAGYANGQFKASYVDYDGILDSESGSENKSAFRIGAGVEQAFTPNFYGKLEYRYTTYGKDDIGNGISFGFNRNQVLAAVGYRF